MIRPHIWPWAVALALASVAVASRTHWMIWLGRPADTLQAFGVALLLAAATALPTIAWIGWLDRRAPAPPWLYSIVAAYGALIATGRAPRRSDADPPDVYAD